MVKYMSGFLKSRCQYKMIKPNLGQNPLYFARIQPQWDIDSHTYYMYKLMLRSNHYVLPEIALKGLMGTLQGLREEVWEDPVPVKSTESKS